LALRGRRQRLRGAEQPARPLWSGKGGPGRGGADRQAGGALALRPPPGLREPPGRPLCPPGGGGFDENISIRGREEEMRRIALLVLTAAVCSLPAAAEDQTAALPQLEAAVAADPENLRAASEYRMAVIKAGAYDRCLEFFEKLVADHPQAANAWLNFGFAYVDKIPAADALTQFSKSIELRKSWLALYTRGNGYLYWPKIFGRAPLGVTDLEEAVAIARKEEKKKAVYTRSFAA